jgi:hypothetical protein
MSTLSLDEVGLPLNPVEYADQVRMDINARFKERGNHPECYRCRHAHECRQYNAENSTMIYCYDRRPHD